MAGVSLAIAAVSVGLQAASIHQSNEAASSQAKSLDAQGKEEARQVRIRGRRIEGQQRTRAAAAGIDVSDASSTSMDLLAQNAEETELNALRARFGFDSAAQGIRSEADQNQLAGIAGIFNTAVNAGFAAERLGFGSGGKDPLIGFRSATRSAGATASIGLRRG